MFDRGVQLIFIPQVHAGFTTITNFALTADIQLVKDPFRGRTLCLMWF